MGDGIRGTTGLLCGLVLLIGLGAALSAPAAAQRRFPRTWTLVPPADRSDAPPLVLHPAFALGDLEYATVMSLLADVGSNDDAVSTRATSDAFRAIARADAAYTAAATTPALLAAAHARLGNLYDAYTLSLIHI